MYTTDGFDTDAKLLRADTRGCNWAKSTPLFTTGSADLDEDRILCITTGKYSPWPDDYRLLISDSYFTSDSEDDGEFEPEFRTWPDCHRGCEYGHSQEVPSCSGHVEEH